MPQNEPVVSAGALAGVLSAVLLWVRMMGWINWTDDQFNQFMIVVSLVLPIVTGIWARQRVTPLAAPRDTDGAPLSRPGDVPANKELEALQTDAIEINLSGGL